MSFKKLNIMWLSELTIFKKRFAVLFFIFFAVIFILYIFFMEKAFSFVEAKKKFQEIKVKTFFFEKRLKKTSFKNNLKIDLKFSNFFDQIKIFVFEPRPDEDIKKPCIKIFLNGSETIVSSKDIIYLDYDKNIKKYFFSKKETPFWLSFDKSRIKITAKYNLEGKEKIKEKYMDVEFKKEEIVIDDLEFKILKKASLLTPDLFFKYYGDKEEKVLSKKYRLSLEKDKHVYFFDENDIFVWKGDSWRVLKNLKEAKGCSLAQIKPLGSKSFKIDIWSKKTKVKGEIILKKSGYRDSLNVREDFISDIRMRTQKQVSCKFGGQRFIIREKDVLFKKNGKWKIEKFYSFKKILKENKITSEFFVFEGIEKLGTKKIFKGHLFNKNRTQVVKIEKNISKNHGVNLHKKRK